MKRAAEQTKVATPTMASEADHVEIICFSGGAEGADMLFDEMANLAGHEVLHYGFAGMKSTASTSSIKTLGESELLQADEPVRKAGAFLGRYPPKKRYVKNLIRRNFFQVKDSEQVYAVTRWNLSQDNKSSATGQPKQTVEGQLGGGTGWAVAMAMALEVPHIFLYAIEMDQWYRYEYENTNWTKVEASHVPTPSGKYAGIGSRDLGDNGEEAIRSLFANNQNGRDKIS